MGNQPSASPTSKPSSSPTMDPSAEPSVSVTRSPTLRRRKTLKPSGFPTNAPTSPKAPGLAGFDNGFKVDVVSDDSDEAGQYMYVARGDHDAGTSLGISIFVLLFHVILYFYFFLC